MKSSVITFILLFPLGALFGNDSGLKEVAKALQDSARKTRMEKELAYAIEDREGMLAAGLERKNIDPREEKKIRRGILKLRMMEKSMKSKGALSVQELRKFHAELAYVYHLIYFASRKEGEFIYTLEGGKKFYLLPQYQRRADRASLSRKDMAEIHKVMNRVWRLRSRLKDSRLPEKERKQILEDSAILLQEKYFTETKPVPPVKKEKRRSGK